MKASEFSADACQLDKLFCVVGDDIGMISHVEGTAISLIDKSDRDFSLSVINKIEKIADIEEAILALPMLGGCTVTLVRDSRFKGTDADRKRLAAALDNIYEEAVLVLINPSFLDAPLKRRFKSVQADRPDAFEACKLIKKQLPHIQFQTGAAERLAAACNSNVCRMAVEAEKLFAYKNKEAITAEDVRLLVAVDADSRTYELANALLDKNNVRAMNLFNEFERNGTAYSAIIAMLASSYRRIVFAALSALSDEELAEVLSVKPYAIKKSRETARRHTKDALMRSLTMLEAAEYQFKSGQMSEENAAKTAFARLLLI